MTDLTIARRQRAAEEGDWEEAIERAHLAGLIASGYNAPLLWKRLEQAVQRATNQNVVAERFL